MTWRAAIPLAALAAAGCRWGEDGASLRVTSVSPDHGVRGQTMNVVLGGSGFVDVEEVDFDEPASTRFCSGLRVELRSAGRSPIPLTHVRPKSSTELRARLAGDAYATAVVGPWDVAVVDSRGAEDVLPGAFAVQTCGAPSVACDDGEPTCTTGDTCNGAARCVGTPVADATPCDFDCTDGSVVPGSCVAGACVPGDGSCDPPPACSP